MSSSTLHTHHVPILTIFGLAGADAAQRAQLSPVYLAGAFAGLGIAIGAVKLAASVWGWADRRVDEKIARRFEEHERTSVAELGRVKAEIIGKVQELLRFFDGRPCVAHPEDRRPVVLARPRE